MLDPMARDPGRAPIVVGVDGSEGSRSALRWAAEEAAVRGNPLHVVHVARYPVGFGPTLYPAVNLEIVAAQAEAFAAEVVKETLGSGGGRRPVVHGGVGSAAEVLLQRASGAAMLVIGARGSGGIAGLLLGSVSHHCVHHAHCPVVVVPEPERELDHQTPGPAAAAHVGSSRGVSD